MQTNDMQQRKRKQMNDVPCHYQGTDGMSRLNIWWGDSYE